ncbi:MAG TPA: hypothetical protein VJT72_02450 [Pseudonocardiaceae bacterium]|nr:hypothetical protein [Pseudonocardiaceae bacterium]
MLARNKNVQQTEHGLLRETLRRFLITEVQSSRGVSRCGRVACGAVRRWTHYLLLIRWTVGVGAGRVSVADG